MYIYIYLHIHVHVLIYMYMYMYIIINMCIYIYLCVYVYICIYIYINTYLYNIRLRRVNKLHGLKQASTNPMTWPCHAIGGTAKRRSWEHKMMSQRSRIVTKMVWT